MSNDLRLTIELVPKPCWYSNMRTQVSRSAWDKIRKEVYALYKYHCGVCHVGNVTLHCHEKWQYDDTLHIQKLNGFIALCEMCHHCKHMGLASILAAEGKLDLERVIEHFMNVNQCSRAEYEMLSNEAWSTWRERNMHEWTTELGNYASFVQSKTT